MFLAKDIEPQPTVATDLAAMRAFVLQAQKSYGGGNITLKKWPDGRKVLNVENKKYRLTDEFDGGNPFCGIERLVDKSQGHNIWNGYYHGWLTKKAVSLCGISTTDLFNFLREALQKPSKDTLFRGPASYESGKLHYQNKLEFGGFDCFFGFEKISNLKGEILYYGRYGGGLVDLVEDVGEA